MTFKACKNTQLVAWRPERSLPRSGRASSQALLQGVERCLKDWMTLESVCIYGPYTIRGLYRDLVDGLNLTSSVDTDLRSVVTGKTKRNTRTLVGSATE